MSEGGKHDLRNLVALCGPCHRLIHPDVDRLDADWRDAPLFPAPSADPRMATIRRPVTDDERERYLPELRVLASASPVGENQFAVSEATIPTSPGDALSAADDFEQLLDDAGLTFDTTLTVGVSDPGGNPIRGATVELSVTPRGHDEYRTEETTDASGRARFAVPAGAEVGGRIASDGYEARSVRATTVDSDANAEVQLTPASGSQQSRGSGGGASGGTAGATDDDAPTLGRRGVLAAGAVGVAGLASWALLSDDDPATAAVPEPAWVSELSAGVPLRTLAVSDGEILAGLATGEVHGLSPAGETAWTVDLREQLSDVAALGGTVYVAGRRTVRAVAAGETAWSTRIDEADGEMRVDPAGDHVLVTYRDAAEERVTVAVLDGDSGERRHAFDPGVDTLGDTALSGSRFLVSDGDVLRAFEETGTADPASAGSVEFERDGRLDGLVVHGDRAYVTHLPDSGLYSESWYDTRLWAFDVPTMTALWDEPTSETGSNPPVSVDGSVYYADAHAALALDDSGVERWRRDDFGATAAPAVLDDAVYLGGALDDGWCLRVCAAADGSVRYTARDVRTEPRTSASTGRLVLVGTAGGSVYAYGRE